MRTITFYIVLMLLMVLSFACAASQPASSNARPPVAVVPLPNPLTASLSASLSATLSPALIPTKRDDRLDRHERFNAVSREGAARLVFLGDSITQGWEGAGKDVWAARYATRNAANFGIGGDRTEHLLWRIDNGNFEGISPRLIILHIGTNNTRHRVDCPHETAAGIRAVLDRLRARCPDARILVLAIFPRGSDADDPYRRINQKANAIVATYADNAHVFYKDIGDAFLLPDAAPQADPAKPEKGRLKPGMMPDQLHLSAEGYQAWADAIEPDVRRLMGE